MAEDHAADAAKYLAENIVLVKVPHDRVCRGETDEVVTRVRSVEAERGVVEACGEAGGYPDWFADRWVGNVGAKDPYGHMVTVACFDDAEMAAKFREELGRTGPEPGGAKHCGVELVDDPEWAEREAAHFSEEWRKARDSERSKAVKALEAAKANGTAERTRLVVLHVKDAGVAQGFMDGLKEGFDEVGMPDDSILVTSLLKDNVLTACIGVAGDGEAERNFLKPGGGCGEHRLLDVSGMDVAAMSDAELFTAAAVVEALAEKLGERDAASEAAKPEAAEA